MTLPTIVSGPTIVSTYPSSTVSFVVPGAAAVGDLLICHCANGNTATSTDTMSGGSSAWTLLTAATNGRNTWYKTLASGDLGQTMSQTAGSNKALSYVIIRNGAVVPSLSGIYTPTGPSGTVAKDSWSFKVFNESAWSAGNFPNQLATDSSDHWEWKSFTAGSTLGTYTTATGAWHNTNGYNVFTVEQAGSPPTAPTSLTVTNSPVPLGGQATATWTHNDPDGNAQIQYQIRWRKV